MSLSHEHLRSKILAKIKIYILSRAELLCSLCYEIPCSRKKNKSNMTNELTCGLTPAFFKQVFLSADKDDDCKITLKQLGK